MRQPLPTPPKAIPVRDVVQALIKRHRARVNHLSDMDILELLEDTIYNDRLRYEDAPPSPEE